MNNLEDIFFGTLKEIRNYLLLVDSEAVKGKIPHKDGFIFNNSPKGMVNGILIKDCYLVLYNLNYGERRDEIAQIYDIQLVLHEKQNLPFDNYNHQTVFKVKGKFFRIFGESDDFMGTIVYYWSTAHEVKLDLTHKLGFVPIEFNSCKKSLEDV